MIPSPKKWFSAFLSIVAMVFLGACNSTPVPTGNQIVSVSWVNTKPGSIDYIQSTLCGNKTPVAFEKLPGYSETAVPVNQPLYENCQVETKIVSGGRSISLGNVWVSPPLRKSPTNEYNVRIQLLTGLPPKVTLEPIRLMRARLNPAKD